MCYEWRLSGPNEDLIYVELFGNHTTRLLENTVKFNLIWKYFRIPTKISFVRFTVVLLGSKRPWYHIYDSDVWRFVRVDQRSTS